MTICKIYSNCQEALRTIDPILVAKGLDLEDRHPTYQNQRVLGLVYNTEKDELSYKVKFNTVNEWKAALGLHTWTKRGILRVIASHYDPQGLASPITIRPRRLLQRVWTTELGWDDPLDQTTADTWEQSLEQLLQMPTLRFPRWVGGDKSSSTQMHVFCDASSEVYACALYLRVSQPGFASVNLLAAKARVTPIKTQSVSRSELDACVLGARMARHYNIVHNLSEHDLFFYTDSKNVLFWLTTPPKRLKVFVQRRVAEIQTYVSIEQWGYVNTNDNPADIPTRDITAAELSEFELWRKGPPALREPDYRFVKFRKDAQDVTEDCLGELKTETFLANNSTPYTSVTSLAQKLSVGQIYNGFEKLLRILGFVLKLAGKIQKNSHTDAALNVIYRASQGVSFLAELAALRGGQDPHRESRILKWTPFLDEHGVLRSRSRLEHSTTLAFEVKYPVLLSGEEKIAQLLLHSFHVKYQHPVGASLALAKIQGKYVILGATRRLRKITSQCLVCRKLRPKPQAQIMGPIPRDIVDGPNRAFAVTGLDFAGPFHLKGAARGLRAPIRFVLLLTCMRTRAVHFEICCSQKTYAVVMALIRFACVRGDPCVIYSDNQTSFLGARQEFDQTYRKYRHHELRWETITPRAPHQGGRWERMVQSMKRALFAIGNSTHLKEEEFVTFLAQAADLLNSRPISKGAGDGLYRALTPNHFLLGRADTGLTHKIGNTTRLLGPQYTYLEKAMERLWERFLQEVIVDSREREKWRSPSENLADGQLVLV